MGTFLARLLAKMVADGHITYPPSNLAAIPEPLPEPEPEPEPEPGCADINTASFEQLQEIVHIGPDPAHEIINMILSPAGFRIIPTAERSPRRRVVHGL